MQSVKPVFFIKAAVLCCPDPESLKPFDLETVDVDRNLMPASLRRRASLTTQMAVTAATVACERAGVEPSGLPSVFASVGGEIRVTDELCRALPNRESSLSPTRFHNSVHNTTAGYWGILHQCQAPATAIAALDDTFALGLLEACSQLSQQAGDILLVCYDEYWPQYLAPPMGSLAFSSAWILGSGRNDSGRPMISWPYVAPVEQPLENKLEKLIRLAPVSACIPLIKALQQPGACRVLLSSGPTGWYTNVEAL